MSHVNYRRLRRENRDALRRDHPHWFRQPPLAA